MTSFKMTLNEKNKLCRKSTKFLVGLKNTQHLRCAHHNLQKKDCQILNN